MYHLWLNMEFMKESVKENQQPEAVVAFFSRRREGEVVSPYRPSVRPHWFFIMAVPWLTVILLGAAVALFLGMRVLVPGVMMTLPQASFSSGFQSPIMMVVVPGRESGVHVFLRDDRYSMASEEQRMDLVQAVKRLSAERDVCDAHLYVDSRVAQGDLVEVMDLLRSTGLERVNIVVKP